MKYLKQFIAFTLICIFVTHLLAQIVKTTPPSPPVSEVKKTPFTFVLLDGTPIRMRINRTVSSADAKVDDTVDFEVLEDIKVGEVIVIPRGGTALATVTEAKPRRNMGRPGRLNINIDSVRLITGEKVALRAVKEVKGGSNSAAMTGAIVATSIIFFPAAPLFLFMKGKDITIPKGTEITAYINGDVALDPAKFSSTPNNSFNAEGQNSPGLGSQSSAISIKSSPDGAEISIDGSFVGSTPSSLRLKAGEHTISIKKSGYLDWERRITLTSESNVSLDATLEKSAFSASTPTKEGISKAPIASENQNTNVKPNQDGKRYNEGGYYKFVRGEFADAELSYRTAISLEPYNAIYHSNLAAALNAQGKFDEAEKEMDLASRLSPNTAIFKEYLDLIRSNKNKGTSYKIDPKP